MIPLMVILSFGLSFAYIHYSANLPVQFDPQVQRLFITFLFLCLPVLYGYMRFIRIAVWAQGTTPWRFETQNMGMLDKCKEMVKEWAVIIFLAGVFTGFFHGFLAIPTRWLSDKPVRVALNCVQLNELGRYRMNYRELVAIDPVTGMEWEFVWPARNVSSCPGKIVVEGKSWYTGIYIEQVWNAYP